MFERFTEPARQVVVLAQDEARALKHNHIGTEHLLLGLLRSDENAARDALSSLGVRLEEVRGQVVRIVGFGNEHPLGQIPFTPRGKKVLELSLREAKALDHNYIGPEHILLGLAREDDGVAARMLLDAGIDSDSIRQSVAASLRGRGQEEPPPPWVEPPRRVPYVIATISSDGGRARLLGLWLAAHSAFLAGAILFGSGLLVGWLIWG